MTQFYTQNGWKGSNYKGYRPLKELGGKWNSRLTCGAGWIFSKSKEAALKAALAI